MPGLYDDLSCLYLSGATTLGYSSRLHSLLTFTPGDPNPTLLRLPPSKRTSSCLTLLPTAHQTQHPTLLLLTTTSLFLVTLQPKQQIQVLSDLDHSRTLTYLPGTLTQ